MKQTKHTPGPWRNDYSPSTGFGCGYGKSQIIDGDNRPIAAVAAVEPPDAPMYEKGEFSQATLDLLEANARLIAAAPELLEACKLLYKAWEELLPNLKNGVVQDYGLVLTTAPLKATAAIAKAEGSEISLTRKEE